MDSPPTYSKSKVLTMDYDRTSSSLAHPLTMDYDHTSSSLAHPFATVSLVHATSATSASLLFLKHTKHIPAAGFLSWLYPLPGSFFPSDIHVVLSLICFRSLLKYHILMRPILTTVFNTATPSYNISFLFPNLIHFFYSPNHNITLIN